MNWPRCDAYRDANDQRVGELLSKPLCVDDVVQVALLDNRGLQASFQELGITEAEVVQAGRLSNTGFSFGRSSKGDEREIERGLHFNLARRMEQVGRSNPVHPARPPARPAPPAALDLPDIERVAMAQRLDVQGARLATEQTARNLGLTKTTRFISSTCWKWA